MIDDTGGVSYSGTVTPVVRDVYVHELTNYDMVEEVGYYSFFSIINSNLITIIQSDKNGFFQVELEPGKYSFFVKEDSLFFANLSDSYGNILSAEVIQDSVTQVKIDINYLASY